MADEFVYFMVGGLAIIGILFVVFGFSGVGFAGQSGFNNVYYTSPVLIGVVPVDSVQTLSASFTADNYIRNDAFDLGQRKISNGLLFGDTPVRLSIDSQFTKVAFDVTKTNGYGDMIFRMDGNIVDRETLAEGHYEFDLGAGKVLEIQAENSEWRMWAPAVYELDNLRVIASNYPNERTTYAFDTNRADVNAVRFDFHMLSNAGRLVVKLNGNTIYDGAINDEQSINVDPSLLDNTNILTFDAGQDSKFEGRVTIALTHRTLDLRDFVADINMSGSDYSRFSKGTVSFDVTNIYSPGGYSVSIVNGGQLLAKEYVKLEKGFFVMNVDTSSLRAGLNQFIVTPVDGASFAIQNFNTQL